MARALYYFNSHKTLGQILIDQGLISSDQLKAALSKQKYINEMWEHIRPLGLLLIEMGYINSRGLLAALSNHFNMPILSLKNYKPNPQLQKVIGERYAMEHKIVVLDNGPKSIKLVQAEPSIQIMEDLQKTISQGKVIEFYLASYSEIDESLRKVAAAISSTPHL